MKSIPDPRVIAGAKEVFLGMAVATDAATKVGRLYATKGTTGFSLDRLGVIALIQSLGRFIDTGSVSVDDESNSVMGVGEKYQISVECGGSLKMKKRYPRTFVFLQGHRVIFVLIFFSLILGRD